MIIFLLALALTFLSPLLLFPFFPLSPPPSLLTACNDPSLMTSSSWFGRLEASGWLNHVTRLLTAAKFVSICIHKDGVRLAIDLVAREERYFLIVLYLLSLLPLLFTFHLFPLPPSHSSPLSPPLLSALLYTLSIASSVVVHGAGSRDATLQVTSLAQILLDSHCRTVHGYVSTHTRTTHTQHIMLSHPPTHTHPHPHPPKLP